MGGENGGVMDISNCANQNKVRFATNSLIGKALTWWNTQIQARGREAAMGITWDEFKALLTEEFCPRNEMQKLEQEFWNHEMVGANHAAYTDRFHELAKLVPHLVTPESKRIERYIYGLVPQIRSMVRATEPPTIQSAILKAGALTDDMVREGTLTKPNEKRKDTAESSRGNGNHKRARNDKNPNIENSGKGGYVGNAPKCSLCNYHHYRNTPCNICTKCNRRGHTYKECRSGPRMITPVNAASPNGCFECGSLDHFKKACPKLNQNAGANANRPNQLRLNNGNQNQGNQGNQTLGGRS